MMEFFWRMWDDSLLKNLAWYLLVEETSMAVSRKQAWWMR